MGADLTEFRAAHGRLCTLFAYAVTSGIDRATAAEAARGNGVPFGPTLTALKRQRVRVNRTIIRAQDAGATLNELIEAARDVRNVVEEEWHMAIMLQQKKA